jgi:type I restriction enzyme S subunit
MTLGWTSTTLGDIAEVVSGGTPKTSVSEYWDGEIPWATPKDLSDLEGHAISCTPRTISEAGLRSCGATLLPPNSVLLSSRAPIGHVAINGVPMATNQGFKSLVPDPQRVDSKFLYWWLRHARPKLESLGNGATFKEISKKVTARVPILLPPLEQQRRIAALLDDADDLGVKRRSAAAKFDALAHAIFVDMFGHPRSTAVSAATPLGDLVELFSGSTLPDGVEFDGQEGGFALVKVSDLGRPENTRSLSTTAQWRSAHGPAASTCPAGTVVIPKRGGAIATNKKRLTSRASILDPNLMGIRPADERLDTDYLLGWFELLDLETIQSGSSVPQLNKKDLRPLPILVPPRAQQDRYAKAIAHLEQVRTRTQRSAAACGALLASLQTRAFAGEL